MDGEGLCPHCGIGVRFVPVPATTVPVQGAPTQGLALRHLKLESSTEKMSISVARCPSCDHVVLRGSHSDTTITQPFFLWPRVRTAGFAPAEVPSSIRQDFNEALLTLEFSRRASAALSRRCLQGVLVAAGAKKHNLVDQINEIKPSLPPWIADHLDAVRRVGNIAAHPAADVQAGTIMDVEVEEAEWLLDILRDLFEHLYVQKTRSEERRRELDAKLQRLGKGNSGP